MIRLFQRNIALQGILIVVFLVGYWIRPVLEAAPMPTGDTQGVLYNLLARWLQSVPRLVVIVAMLLVLAEGVLLNLLLANANLVSQNSLLPTMLYVVAMSVGATTLTPLILVNAALLVCLHRLMLRGTPFTIDAETVCGVTFALGVASLFYPPAVLFLVSYLLVAIDYRLYSWRDWVAMLLGIVGPYILVVAVLYFTDGLLPWWQSVLQSLRIEPLGFQSASLLAMVGNAVMALMLIWGVLSTASRVGEHPVLWQHNASTVLLLSVGGLLLLLYLHPLPLAMPLFAIPFAFAAYRALTVHTELAGGFSRNKRHRWLYDGMLILTLAAPFIC